MYPMQTWGYEKLVERINGLLFLGMDIEATIAATQTFEQAFKRILRARMATTRRSSFDTETGEVGSFPASTAKQIDASVREMQGIERIVLHWSALYAGSHAESLSSLVEEVAGKGAWQVVRSSFKLRNDLVHGSSAPARTRIEKQARESARILALLLHPKTGIRRAGRVHDPFKRLPNIRHHK